MMVKIRDQVMLFVIQRVTSKQKMGYMVLVNICRNSTKKCWHKLSPLFATITRKLLSFSLKVSETANKPLPSNLQIYNSGHQNKQFRPLGPSEDGESSKASDWTQRSRTTETNTSQSYGREKGINIIGCKF